MSDIAVRARGVIHDIIKVMVDDHKVTNEEIAALTGHSPRIIGHIKRSDSFRSLLAKAVKLRHGEIIDSVRNNELRVANTALTVVNDLLNNDAVLPSTKLELARLALDHHSKNQDRLIPKNPALANQSNTSVVINLTTEELRDAQNASIAYGNAIQLEASDATHTPLLPAPRGNHLPAISEERSKLRSESQ